MDEQSLRRLVGWPSLLFGVGMLLAPYRAARLFGAPGRASLVRFLALRDLTIGLGALTQPNVAPWVRARALSDTIDGVTFAFGVLSGRFQRGRATLSVLAAVGSAALGYSVLRQLEAGEPDT